MTIFLQRLDRTDNIDRGDDNKKYCCCDTNKCNDDPSTLPDCKTKCDLWFTIEVFNGTGSELATEKSEVTEKSPLSTPLHYYFNLSIEDASENVSLIIMLLLLGVQRRFFLNNIT